MSESPAPAAALMLPSWSVRNTLVRSVAAKSQCKGDDDPQEEEGDDVGHHVYLSSCSNSEGFAKDGVG